MKVRDLECWPPKWRGVSSVSGEIAQGEDGVLIAAHCDLRTRSLHLTMEDAGDRYSAILEDELRRLTKLSLLLDWHIGRPLARIGGLEMTL